MPTLKCYERGQKIEKYGKPETKKYDKFAHCPIITKKRDKTCRAHKSLLLTI